MNKGDIVELALAAIQPDPENLRKVFDQDELQALADNFREHGQLDPVQVFTTSTGTYDLWDGERRWRAAKIAELPTLKAIVVPRPSPVDLLCKKVSRFMQTKTLTKPEEVRALEEALKALGVVEKPDDWPRAARKLGIKPSVLQERMRITKLTPELRGKFERGEMHYSISQALGKVGDTKLQTKLADFIIKEDLTNRFAVLQFMPVVLDDPKRSLMESYDVAKHAEKYRYAAPRMKEDVPRQIEARIDDMLEDLRKAIRWLEEAGRKDLIGHLTPENFNTRRILETLRHLGSMSGAFLSAYQARYGSAESRSNSNKSVPQRSGSKRLLEAVSSSEGKP
jgi:ParB/RepB/Spo0J family partition protein